MIEVASIIKELWIEPRDNRCALVVATGPNSPPLPEGPFALDLGGGVLLRFRYVADLGARRFHESDGIAAPADGLPVLGLAGPARDRVIPSGITGVEE